MSSPLFVESIKTADVSPFQLGLQGWSGPHAGTKYFSFFKGETGKVAAATPSIFDPSTLDEVKALALLHPLICWKKLKFQIAEGPGAFGRSVYIHYAWIAPGRAMPTTLDEFRAVPGYACHAYGGAFTVSGRGQWQDVPFSGARHGIVKSGLVTLTSPMRLAWFIDSADIATVKGTGDLAEIVLTGEFDLFGQYF